MSFSPERRRLLKMLGLGTAAAMPAFRPGRLVSAAPAPAGKYFFAALMMNGVVRETFWPSGTGEETPLAGVALPASLAPLEPFKSKLLVVKGLKNAASAAIPGVQHTEVTAFSGAALATGKPYSHQGITIDQHIATTTAASQAPVKSLQYALAFGPPGATAFASGPSAPLSMIRKPEDAFAKVFGDLVAPAPGGPPPSTADLEALRFRRKSVLDHIGKDLTAVSKRLGGTDRQRMDAHVTAIRQIESSLPSATPAAVGAGPGGATCAKPASYMTPTCPKDNAGLNPECNRLIPEMSKALMDITAAAFACDRTRVAGIQYGTHTDITVYSWLDVPQQHHELSHMEYNGKLPKPQAQALLTKIVTWHIRTLAYFLERLQSYRTSDGTTLFDNALSFWTSEIGNGDHTLSNIPVVMVGGAGGALRGGRFLNVTGRNTNDALLTCANAMGSPVETFGTPAYCKGAFV